MLTSAVAHAAIDTSSDAEPYPQHQVGTSLRVLTCGSVDDGKSTLIGRLLHDTRFLREDEAAALNRDSRRWGTTEGEPDLALLVDGLDAEREQGITIDVAYRFFSTPRRAFVLVDTPGHEQYTRNMATGASNADLAVLLVDARKGLLDQTRRHAAIVSLLGIRHVVLAVNKIDLVDFDAAVFDAIAAGFRAVAEPLGFLSITTIPISARFGDNVATVSARTPWYGGPSLLAMLEAIDIGEVTQAKPFRFPVQWVNRPDLDFRGVSGTIASGRIAVGDEVVTAAAGRTTRVARIVTFDGDLAEAAAGDAVTLTFAEPIDVARGDLLADPKERPAMTRRFLANLVWMAEDALKAGRRVLLKTGGTTVSATPRHIVHRLDVTTLAPRSADTLVLNDVGRVEIETPMPLAFDRYDDNHDTGSFILIDPVTHATLAAGMVIETLEAARDVHRHPTLVTAVDRARAKGQVPLVVWLTGLPSSGKSTIANLVETRLHALGHHCAILDGDALRQGLNADLGFGPAARSENAPRRRGGEADGRGRADRAGRAGVAVPCGSRPCCRAVSRGAFSKFLSTRRSKSAARAIRKDLRQSRQRAHRRVYRPRSALRAAARAGTRARYRP
ncbi:MAG: sulfate adenylyltransferase subunit CysN [Xanthobacteraceae bacterium]